MIRTMQTAALALDWLVEKGVVFEASADWQGEFAHYTTFFLPIYSNLIPFKVPNISA